MMQANPLHCIPSQYSKQSLLESMLLYTFGALMCVHLAFKLDNRLVS